MRMATIDSGTETLFSDDSPFDLGRTSSVCSGEETEVQILESTRERSDRIAPPNIQPYSGVLGKVGSCTIKIT